MGKPGIFRKWVSPPGLVGGHPTVSLDRLPKFDKKIERAPNQETTDLSMEDVLEFVVNQGNGVKGLSQSGLETVPIQYVQPLEERLESLSISESESIPVIDWEESGVEESICSAASKYGAFQLINHGIPEEVCRGVRDGARRFFEQTGEDKLKYGGEWAKYGTSITLHSDKVWEWRDILSLRFGSHSHDVSSSWPPSCREEAVEFYNRSEPIINKVAGALMKGLGAPNNHQPEQRPTITSSPSILLNYYPTCPNPNLTAGVCRHSDASSVTLLLQDHVPGLYIRSPSPDSGGGAWIHVPPIEGALVVNIGDALQIISNGKYKSIEHRVVTSADEDRVSVAVFACPGVEDLIGPLPEIIARSEEPVYREVLYGDYRNYYFGRRLDGKKPIEWAMIDQ